MNAARLAALQERMRDHMAEVALSAGAELEPERWRYVQHEGVLYCWNTTPIVYVRSVKGVVVESVPERGAWESYVLVPVGKGSRSGKPEEWERRDALTSRHRTRTDAKARAVRLCREAGGDPR